MKTKITLLAFLITTFAFGQNKDLEKQRQLTLQQSNDLVYEGNELLNENFVSAEKEYRKAISKAPSNAIGNYNLGNAMYEAGHFDEALSKHLAAIKSATTKTEKHRAYHNVGNVLMQQELCQEAVEAFKNALRNNPKDDETRYNLALAKECAKQQGGGEGDDDDENKKDDQKKEDEKKENEDEQEEGDKNEDQDNQGDDNQDQKDGDDKEDEDGKPKDEKDNKEQNKPGDQKKKKPQGEPGKLSPQQVKNLLEAMNNQEKKVQEKINAKKTKGVRVQTEKDW